MADAKVESQPLEIKTTGLSWVIAILVSCSYMVSFITRFTWATAIPVAAPDLGINMAAAGGLMTAYFGGYVVGNFITGFAVDRFGPKLTLTCATGLTGLFTVLIPFAPNYWLIFALRVCAGFVSGPLFSCVTKYQISWFARNVRTIAMGVMMAGAAVGTSIASAVFAPIIRNVGWRTGFTYGAICCFIVAALTFFICKEQGPAAQRAVVAKNATPEEKAAQRAGLKEVVLRKSFLFGTIACFLSIAQNTGFNTYIVRYFTLVRGFDLVTAGLIVGSTQMVGLFSGTLAGIVADLVIKSKKRTALIGTILSIACFFGILFATNTAFLIFVMVVRLVVAAWFGTPLNGLQSQAAAGPFSGRAMGLYNGIAQCGSTISPIIFGMILDMTGDNYSIIFITIMCMLAVNGTLVQLMEERKVEPPKPAAT